MTARDMREFSSFLRDLTDAQVQGVYDKESAAGREDYAQLASLEADRRDLFLDGDEYDEEEQS